MTPALFPTLETQKLRARQMGEQDALEHQLENPFPEGSLLNRAWYEGFSSLVCNDCGGRSYDDGDPSTGYSGGACQTCHGTGLEPEPEERNYLSEAFQIVAGGDPTLTCERAHIVAVIEHCRKLTSAALMLPQTERVA